MDQSELDELDELRARVLQLEAMLAAVPGNWRDINELLARHESRLNFAGEGSLMERLQQLLTVLDTDSQKLKQMREALDHQLRPIEREFNIYVASDDSIGNRALSAIRHLAAKDRALLKGLGEALQTLAAIREVELQINSNEQTWTHRDRKAIAQLVMGLCAARLDRLSWATRPPDSQTLPTVYTDVVF